MPTLDKRIRRDSTARVSPANAIKGTNVAPTARTSLGMLETGCARKTKATAQKTMAKTANAVTTTRVPPRKPGTSRPACLRLPTKKKRLPQMGPTDSVTLSARSSSSLAGPIASPTTTRTAS